MPKILKKNAFLYSMLIPSFVFAIAFFYVPMAGIVMAFQKFVPARGMFGKQVWVGLQNFRYMLSMPDSFRVFSNTLIIACGKMLFNLIVPVVFSILLNEVRSNRTKRLIQTAIYLPYFVSWVLLASILRDMLSLNGGLINTLLGYLGFEPVNFLVSNQTFRGVLIVSDVWKNFGFNTVVYLAALTNIDPTQYEAAEIDGANRWKQTLHITLPGISTIVALMFILSLREVLNAGFDQVFNLYNPIVYETGDIIDTLVYRIGLENGQFGLSAAIGVFKSVISCILIVTSYKLADKFAGYRVF